LVTSDDGQGSGPDIVARLIGQGFLTDERVRAVRDAYPQVSQSIVRWIGDSAAVGDWRRVEGFASLGSALRAPGLDRVLCEILASDPSGLNKEDVVEILGEIRAIDCASTIFRVMTDSLESDAPAYWLSQKAILALEDLDTDESRQLLFSMTSDDWPQIIRWHAAVALNIEDELGFDEDEMLG
jgi:HEAT repeat protein